MKRKNTRRTNIYVYIKEHNKEKIVKRKQKREEKKLFLQRYINKFPFERKKDKRK